MFSLDLAIENTVGCWPEHRGLKHKIGVRGERITGLHVYTISVGVGDRASWTIPEPSIRMMNRSEESPSGWG